MSRPMLTDDEIRALLEGCEGVTPGPWQLEQNLTYGFYINSEESDVGPIACDIPIVQDAAHIARCDPQTIAELCTRLLNAEARVSDLRSLIKNSDPYLISALTSENNDLQARVKALEEAGRNIKPYLVWTIGPESPGHHPTMRSAVDAFLAALQEQSK
jgi:hypothetical protein